MKRGKSPDLPAIGSGISKRRRTIAYHRFCLNASGPADGHNWPAMLVERPSMGIAYVSNERKISAFAAAALLLSSFSLGGCATSTESSLMDARAEAPAPPKTSVYLPVQDLPPKREKPAMTPDERLKLQKELIAARDRQAPGGKARGSAARAQPMKP
jgi:hypothetical protein